jgi:hypothetical protein
VITDNFSDCSDPISNVVSVIVQPDATVSVAPASSEICIGGSALLTATVVGGSSALTINGNLILVYWSNISGETGTTYTALGTVVGTTTYRVVITDPNSDCSDPVSNAVTVVVRADATVSVAPLTTEVCVGGTLY